MRALVLATCFQREADPFAAFEQQRRERVERIVAQGARSSSSKVPGAVGRIGRDLMLRLMLRFFVTEQSLAWMYDYRVDAVAPGTARPHAEALV